MKGTSPTISALGAYSPSAASSTPRCPKGCGEYLVLTSDAIGRLRERCPRCDGVAHRVTRHPDDAMMPQGLVRASGALPSIAAGQLRCQRCARGVQGEARFCVDCLREQRQAAHKKTCRSCGESFTPKRYQRLCDTCTAKAKAKAVATRRCLNCGAETTGHRGGPAVVKMCQACRPARGTTTAPNYKPKPCKSCGTEFKPSGPRSQHCAWCR